MHANCMNRKEATFDKNFIWLLSKNLKPDKTRIYYRNFEYLEFGIEILKMILHHQQIGCTTRLFNWLLGTQNGNFENH